MVCVCFSSLRTGGWGRTMPRESGRVGWRCVAGNVSISLCHVTSDRSEEVRSRSRSRSRKKRKMKKHAQHPDPVIQSHCNRHHQQSCSTLRVVNGFSRKIQPVRTWSCNILYSGSTIVRHVVITCLLQGCCPLSLPACILTLTCNLGTPAAGSYHL